MVASKVFKFKIITFFFILGVVSFKGALFEYLPSLQRVDTYLLLGSDILIAALGLSALTEAPKVVVWSMITFLCISSLSYLMGPMDNLWMHINGLREIINIYFLFLFFYSLFNNGYQYYFNSIFKYFTYLFLFLQIPFSILQFMKHGASDDVGGTLGAGYSGILTLSIFILVYYLIENNNHNRPDFSKLKYLASKSYFFIPVFLNETKITFILIPIFILSIVGFRKLKSLAFAVIMGGGMLFLFANLFTGYGNKSFHASEKNPINEIYNEDYLKEYLSGNPTGEEVDVPRFTKLMIGVQLLSREQSSLFFGQEYGAFKGGTTMGITSFAAKYFWLLQGSRPYLFYILITGGISLLILILFLFIKFVGAKPYKQFRNFSNGLLIFLCSVFLIILFYNDALRGIFFISIFTYCLFFGKFFNKPIGIIWLNNRWMMV